MNNYKNLDILEIQPAISKDKPDMTQTHPIFEETLKFTKCPKGSNDVAKGLRKNGPRPYKPILVANDLLAISMAFGIGALLAGIGLPLNEHLSQSVVLILLPLIFISSFQSHKLYSYHTIFWPKTHMLNLFKSFGWSMLSIIIIAFLYCRENPFVDVYSAPIVFWGAIVLMLLCRFFWVQLLNIVKAFGLSFVAVVLMEAVLGGTKPTIMDNLKVVLISLPLGLGLVLCSRHLLVQVVFNNWMRRRFRRQVAILGSDKKAKRITNHIIERNAPFWVAGFVSKEGVNKLDALAAKYRLGDFEDLPLIVEENKIDEIIVTKEDIDREVLVYLLDYCRSRKLRLWFDPRTLPIIDEKLQSDTHCGIPMINLCSQKNSQVFDRIKQGLDAVFILPLLLLSMPLFLLIVLAIKANSRGPVFYLTRMVGKDGGTFRMYKFRSMYNGADCEAHRKYVTKFIKNEILQEGGKEQIYKISDDPRVTLVGKFLRKLSLDELPQLINVLKGDMSLVGPRPCLPYEYELYEDWHKKRLCVRPGITGLWQVVARNTVPFEDMVFLDLYYIYNRSLLMDMNILYETIFAVLGNRGAY